MAESPRSVRAGSGACAPFADRVLAWDAAADLYVVATHLARRRPPTPSTPPDLLELRRLSSGHQLAVVSCADRSGAFTGDAVSICDPRVDLAAHLPRTARLAFRPSGAGRDGLRARLSLREIVERDGRSVALYAVGAGGRRERILYLAHRPPTASMRARVVDVESFAPAVAAKVDGDSKITGAAKPAAAAKLRDRGDLLVMAELNVREGACERTEAVMVRIPIADLDRPAAPERQARLLARRKPPLAFEEWRSAAEIAALPADKVLSGLLAAVNADRPDLAARWWSETAAALPIEQIAPLATTLRERPELSEVRALVNLPSPPPPSPAPPAPP